ncbi:MAG: hypothetical protein IPH45_04355 [Bacteroidales bacterium]|nr:hypothetical protein [Bacteroidales bacterium]
MADAVKKDRLGLGYNNVIYAYDIKSRKFYPGLEVLPIDINNNEMIDPEEDFYSSLDSIMLAIRDGRYPAPRPGTFSLISKREPVKQSVKDFLLWILTEGQQFVHEAGYVQLKDEQIETEKSRLNK